nr:ORF I polyprotein [Ipomoea batatas]
MEFHRPSLRKELDLSVEKDLIKFLTWFYPLKYWKKLCQDGPEFFTVHLHREVTAWVSRFLEGNAEPFMKIYEQHMESIIVREEDYPEFQRYIFAQNKVIPKEIWPREGIQPDVRQDDEIYYERIKSARNQYYYELSQVKKGEDIWSQDPWNFDDIDSVLEEVEKIEKAYAQKSRKKRPEDKSQWNKDVWRTKRRQSGMDRQEWVNYMGYPSYSSYSTESDTASDEDSVMDLQFRGEWMIMKAKQPGPSLRKELDLSVEKDLIKFLTWFYPLKYWKKLCQDGPEFFTVHLHREVTAWVSRFLEGNAEPFMKIYEQHMESIIVREEDYPEFQRYIFAQNKVKKGEDIWSQDPWNFDDIDSVLEEVEKIEKAYAQKSRKKRPEDKSQWNKDVWRTKRRQSGMDRQEWVNYMGYPSYSSYSTESDTASDEDSVMDLQFRGEWMIMKANQPGWNPQNWKGKRFMNEG